MSTSETAFGLIKPSDVNSRNVGDVIHRHFELDGLRVVNIRLFEMTDVLGRQIRSQFSDCVDTTGNDGEVAVAIAVSGTDALEKVNRRLSDVCSGNGHRDCVTQANRPYVSIDNGDATRDISTFFNGTTFEVPDRTIVLPEEDRQSIDFAATLKKGTAPAAFASEANITMAMMKPDAVINRHVAGVLKQAEKLGTLSGLKMMVPSNGLLSTHYSHVESGAPQVFTERLVPSMSNPVIPMVLNGDGIVGRWRAVMGRTNSALAETGTLRARFGKDATMNVVHGSGSLEEAKHEIEWWFDDSELL